MAVAEEAESTTIQLANVATALGCGGMWGIIPAALRPEFGLQNLGLMYDDGGEDVDHDGSDSTKGTDSDSGTVLMNNGMTFFGPMVVYKEAEMDTLVRKLGRYGVRRMFSESQGVDFETV